eukprot:jgi/Ulvmu1/11164/UM071_0048.1
MASEGFDGPPCDRKGSPFVPEQLENFLNSHGVKRLNAAVPVAAAAAQQWISANRETVRGASEPEMGTDTKIPATITIKGIVDPVSTAAIADFSTDGLTALLGPAEGASIAVPASVCGLSTLQCFLKLLEGKPGEFEMQGEEEEDDSQNSERMGQPSEAPKEHFIHMRTAFELFAAARYFHTAPKLWPCLLLYLKPLLPNLSMDEAAWMTACMLAVLPPAQYRSVFDSLFNSESICVGVGSDAERSRLAHASEPMLTVLGTAFWRMFTAALSGATVHWINLVAAVSSNPHVPAPVALGLFATACMLATEDRSSSPTAAEPAADAEVAMSLGDTVDCFLAYVLRQGAGMSAVRTMIAEAAGQFEFGEQTKAMEAVLPRLRALESVAGRATAATASDARSRASGEDAGSQDGDSGSLDAEVQVAAVERTLRHESAARGLVQMARGDCCVLRWALHTCPAHRIVVARLQVPTTDGESVSVEAGGLAMAVSCVEARLGTSGDSGGAACSLGVSVRYGSETKGSPGMVFAQAAAEAARPTAAQWSMPAGGGRPYAAREVYVHALGVLPTTRSSSQSSRVADALCAVQEAWEGDWGVRETSHDWYALASDGVPVPMIHRVVEGGGMEMQPGSAAGVNNLWGVSQFCHGAFSWLSRGAGASSRPDLLGKEVFVYACVEV